MQLRFDSSRRGEALRRRDMAPDRLSAGLRGRGLLVSAVIACPYSTDPIRGGGEIACPFRCGRRSAWNPPQGRNGGADFPCRINLSLFIPCG